MPVSIRQLLEFGGERLRLIVPSQLDADIADRELSWVHGSDLIDPTPFLEAGHLLLTDGSQFSVDGERQVIYDDYVSRLVEKHITGIGFGSQLVHMGIPNGLIRACQEQNLPLIELADKTPYFDYVKYVANTLSHDETADDLRTLKAQRAITRAALKPDGLGAVLSELGRRIGCEVILYNSAGKRIGTSASITPSEADLLIDGHVTSALRQGKRASRIVQLDDRQYTIQTIGNHASLDGAISFGQVSLDQPLLNDLIANVVAIASLVLTQHRMLTETRSELRTVSLGGLVDGKHELASRTVEVLRGQLPEAPFSVFVTSPSRNSPFISEVLERVLDELDGSIFYGTQDPYLVLLVEDANAHAFLDVLTQQDVTVGVASTVDYENFQQGFYRAERAFKRAVELGQSSSNFDEIVDAGIFSLLASADATAVAENRVQILDEAATGDTDTLLNSARVWLQHDCSWELASRELEVHRHTLRNRIDSIARALSLDLQSVEGRMELWATLQLTQVGVRSRN